MSRKQTKQERLRQSLNDALSRIEVFDCCTARGEAEQILREHPKLQRDYKPFVIDYKLNLN